MDSKAYDRFRFAFFEDTLSAHDGLDIEALTALNGSDRAKAEQALLDFLPDTRAVIGLGELRSQRAHEPLQDLIRRLPRQEMYCGAAVELAKALYLMRPEERWSAYLFDILRHGDEWTARMEATIALRLMPEIQTADALKFALDDTERLVRHHASISLYLLHGLAQPPSDPQHAVYLIMAESGERREGGKRDVLAAITGREMTPSFRGK
jgi:hypothetical protein